MIALFILVFVVSLYLFGTIILWRLFPNFARWTFAGIVLVGALIGLFSFTAVGLLSAVVFFVIAWFLWSIVPKLIHGPNWKESGLYHPVTLFPEGTFESKADSTATEAAPKPLVFQRRDPFEGMRYVKKS